MLTILQKLTHIDVDFKWGPSEQATLHRLKTTFCSIPILAYLDPQEQFLVDTNASDYAVGGVLSQVQNGVEKNHVWL